MKKVTCILIAAFAFSALAFSQPVPSYVPTNGLVGWWPFNGNANDESGNGNNGTVYGAALTTDRFGNANKAYSFDGVSSYISATKNTIFSAEITFSAWVYLNTLSGTQTFIESWGPSTTQRTFTLYIESNIYRTSVQTLSGQFYANGNTPNIAVWSMLTGSFNGSILKLYLNGQLIQSTNISSTTFNSSQYAFYSFGRQYPSIQFFNGILDDIGIWNRALTPCEIQALYQSGISGISLTASTTTLCMNDSPVSLLALPSGGTWSGAGVTGNSFNPTTAGGGVHYAVYTVTNSSSCQVSDSIALTVNLCTGTNQINQEANAFSIFPNPATDNVLVSWTASTEVHSLTLTDAMGRVVRSISVNGTQAQLSLDGLSSGVYFITVNDDKRSVQKIVKE
ncbi:MAG: T9SS type A sorting domain-containing protein [Bacteroidetes bacterium]|nr:T9SS type A sorting domain-containing protein [Bacteroidota bacterium]